MNSTCRLDGFLVSPQEMAVRELTSIPALPVSFGKDDVIIDACLLRTAGRVNKGEETARGSFDTRGYVALFMLISVHLPKTAGSSFLAALECHFGERLLEDFADRPLHTSAFRRNFHAVQAYLRNALPRSDLEAVECIHGHFLPLKYVSLQTASSKKYVVWMRDPIERQASHYFYWIRNYNPQRAGELHRRVVEEEWSLERFCLGPEMRNIYSKFLWGFSLSRFDFIGITEFYETEIEQF
jgi:hypothetical protein